MIYSLASLIIRHKLVYWNFCFIGAIVVYDATDVDSFKKMNQWVTELRNYLPAEIPILIAGNKSDLYNNIAIQEEMARNYAKSHNSQYFATSAKTGNGV